MTKSKHPDRSGELSAFAWVDGLWLLSGLVIGALFFENRIEAAGWLFLFWFGASIDLLAMAELFRCLLALGQPQGSSLFRTLLWAMLKFLALGGLGVLVWAAKETPRFSLLWGLATLMVVPLFGGVWAHLKQRQK